MHVQLQPVLEQLHKGMQLLPAGRAVHAADFRGCIGNMGNVPVLLVECKLDSSGNTLGQALRYYVDEVTELQAGEMSWWVRTTCTPMFILEISGNRVRFAAAAYQGGVILAEPLLDVTCKHEEPQISTLAQGLQGLQRGLQKIQDTFNAARSDEGSDAALQSAAFPQFLSTLFPDATFKSAYNSSRMWCVTITTNRMEVEATSSSGGEGHSDTHCSHESLVKLVRARPGDPALEAHKLIADLHYDEALGHGCAPRMVSVLVTPLDSSWACEQVQSLRHIVRKIFVPSHT